MKKITISILSVVISIVCIFSLLSCQRSDGTQTNDIWENATYKSDKTLGQGQNLIQVEVKVNDHSVTFNINTDKETLGEALLEHELISGDIGQFGMYVKVVNGITADYDIDQSYWGIYKNGEYVMSGVDTTPISSGEHYEFVYTK